MVYKCSTMNYRSKRSIQIGADHGVSFEEAATVFLIDGAEEFDDVGHSDGEERIIVVGLSQEMRILTVIHCWRENDTIIRIISARKATHVEEKLWKR